jgi:hypothetical protein
MRPRGLVAAAAVLVVAVAVLVVILLTRGGPSPAPGRSRASPSSSSSPSPTKSRPPAVARFELIQLSSASGSRHPRHSKIRLRARATALRIKAVIARLYTYGFLDTRRPASRMLGLFVGDARRRARTHPQVITLGTRARRLRGLREQHSTLMVRTLFSPQNHPLTALAVARFRASGRTRGGARLLVRSTGSFFLRPGRHGWVIYGFEIRRRDRSRAR